MRKIKEDVCQHDKDIAVIKVNVEYIADNMKNLVSKNEIGWIKVILLGAWSAIFGIIGWLFVVINIGE